MTKSLKHPHKITLITNSEQTSLFNNDIDSIIICDLLPISPNQTNLIAETLQKYFTNRK